MVKRRIGVIAFLLCFCFCSVCCPAQAASTADASSPINAEADCSLTLSYLYNETAFEKVAVRLYKIADLSADFQYTPTEPFAASDLILNGIQTNGEWDILRSTLEARILANRIPADATADTDAAGQVCFSGLSTGLYLALADSATKNDWTYAFEAALLTLPKLDENGQWQYQVSAIPKPEALPPIETDETIELSVLKLWKGDSEQKERPAGIEIEIFRNGESYKTVTLSPETNWSYNWSAKKDGADWAVAEKKVPTGYTVTVEERKTSFIVTNTFTPNVPESPQTPPQTPQDPPQTGDTSNTLLYIILMNGSGILLILLGIIGKRRRG